MYRSQGFVLYGAQKQLSRVHTLDKNMSCTVLPWFKRMWLHHSHSSYNPHGLMCDESKHSTANWINSSEVIVYIYWMPPSNDGCWYINHFRGNGAGINGAGHCRYGRCCTVYSCFVVYQLGCILLPIRSLVLQVRPNTYCWNSDHYRWLAAPLSDVKVHLTPTSSQWVQPYLCICVKGYTE